jgi:hypothetical protein
MHFRDVYIPVYYVDHLLTKLEKLKQASRTVKQYYHDFKICILFGGLDECMEDVWVGSWEGSILKFEPC